MFDADELQNPQRAVALIGAILVIAGVYMDWMALNDDLEDFIDAWDDEFGTGDSDDVETTLTDIAGADDDGEPNEDGDYNANFVLIGGIASLAVAALSRPKLEESIGEGNYPIAVMVIGIIALFAVYSNYSQLTDDIDEGNDMLDDLDLSADYDDAEYGTGMGAYACLLGAVMVVGSGAWQKFGEQEGAGP
jgi:hypothetical protein